MSIFLSLFAGIGLIFIGSQFLTVGIKQMVGTRLRDVLAKSTDGTWRPITAGIAAGAILQSPNAITFIAAGLIGGGALTVEAASLIVTWSYVGNLVKLFAAAIDLHAIALVALGVVGIGYYAGWDKHRVRQHWLKALLGLSLLLSGIHLIQLGRPRDELLAELRSRMMGRSGEFSRKQQEAFYMATRLFERMVWLVHRIGTSLAAVRRAPIGA